MITSINPINEKAVLLDASLFIASVFTGGTDDGMSEQCSDFLEYCTSSGILIHVAPEAVTRLWKVLIQSRQESIKRRLIQSPVNSPLAQTAQRIRNFLKSPFHLLKITPSILEKGVELWEQSGGEAEIEACVTLCAFREVARGKHVVVTANSHYDALDSPDITIMKPSALIGEVATLQKSSPLSSDELQRGATEVTERSDDVMPPLPHEMHGVGD